MSGLIGTLFREHATEFIEQHGHELSEQQRKAITAIRQCGTSACGALAFRCDDCGTVHVLERSCGNRMCPSCQSSKTDQWLDKRLARQLPIHYFMLTFTVPEQLRAFMLHRPKVAFDALFKASSLALKRLAANPRHIGVDLPGFFGVLHTWGSTLQFHPHIHFVVPGGGIDKASGLWRSSRADFFVPVQALSKVVRGVFQELMIKQEMIGSIDPEVWRVTWNVNSQAVGHNREGVLKYLATYVFKTAITDSRIVSVAKAMVTFTYRKKGAARRRRMTLAVGEFIRRYLTHVLPPGFMRIRYYGFMSAAANVPHQRLLALVELSQSFEVQQLAHTPKQPVTLRCALCGGTLSFQRILNPSTPLLAGIPRPARHKLE